MTSSIRNHILASLAPEHGLRCRRNLWNRLLGELARRGRGSRESGAFLLGRRIGHRREILDAVYYDDLAPEALVNGAILFPGSAYGALWQYCRSKGWQVVADIHTHPHTAFQSTVDRVHPMIAEIGHIALIAPRYGQAPIADSEIGVFEYMGGHRWRDRSGAAGSRYFLRTRI